MITSTRRTIIERKDAPAPYPGFSPAVRFDRWVFFSGQMASDFKSGLAPEIQGNPAMPLAGEDIRLRECRYIFKELGRSFNAAGAKLEDSVRIDQFPTTRSIMDPYHVVRKQVLTHPRPMSTSVLASSLLVPACQIAVDLIAGLPGGDFSKQVVSTENVPASIFGVAPALRIGDFVFVAAQVATDFRTGIAPEALRNPAFWEGSEIEMETRYIIRNFETVLKAAGSSLANVVKAFVYLIDITDIPRFDAVWREAFPRDPPARTIVPCAGLGVVGTRVEINLVALADAGRTRKEPVRGSGIADPLFHETPAMRAGNLLFLSGLMGADANGLAPSARVNPYHPYVTDSAAAQTESILDQAEAICHAAGASISNAVRMLSVHTNMDQWVRCASVWQKRFTAGDPATTSIAMPAPLSVPGASILLDLWVGIDN